MPPYDSESSSEGEEYAETNVLLGYASTDATADTISHLGGQPTWLDEKTTPSGALSRCKVCRGLLTLLLELNGDLPEHFPGHERRLYLWACRRKTCRRKEGSVRAVRGVRVAKGAGAKVSRKKCDEKQDTKIPQANLGGSLFGVKNGNRATATVNPFSSSADGKMPENPFSSSSPADNPFPHSTPTIQVMSEEIKDEANTTLSETFASKVRLNLPPPSSQLAQPHEPWPAESSFPPAYPHYYLDAEYETLDAPSKPDVPNSTGLDMSVEGRAGAGKEDKDIFESSLDKTFQKFADRIGQNPEQVLRYEFKGKPLLYSDCDMVGKLLAPNLEHGICSNTRVATTSSKGESGTPRCQNCGANRVFEAQLTPHAITELEADDMNIDGMEWGTIILGVCSKDCQPDDIAEGEVAFLEEWAGVQWEEVTSER